MNKKIFAGPIRHLCRIALAASSMIAIAAGPALPQSKSAPKIPTPTVPQTATTPAPPSAVGTPMTSPSPVAPLSPQLTTTPLTGGTVRPDKLPSPSTLSTSPSESAQSTAGGGGRTLEDCIKFWDRGTHMTKSEWRIACTRSQHRLDNLRIDDLTIGLPNKPSAKKPRVQLKVEPRTAG
jgi:hypothetical protein